MARTKLLSALLLTLMCMAVMAVSVCAQGKPTEVIIYSVDTAQLPAIRVQVAPTQADGTLVTGLGQDAFRIYEDGSARPVEAVTTVEQGAQVAFVLDASGSINSPGATRKARSQEAIEAIDDLVMTDKWVNRAKNLDRWMLIVPKGATDFRVAQEWTNQPVAIHNNAYSYDFRSQTTDTPLYGMLVEALARMKDVSDYETRPKFLIVLSDGVDRTSKSDISDAINRATRLGVKVLSIKLGSEAEGAAGNLYRLAKETDGALVTYTGINALQDLYGRIRAQRSPYEVVFRSAISTSGKHIVQAGVVLSGREIRSTAVEVGIAVDLPTVRIVEPTSPVLIERIGDRWDVDPKTLAPRDIPVAVEVNWPQGRARVVQQITYIVDGVPVSSLTPDQRFVWDFSALPAGPHAVVAEIKDELGVTARSEPLQANISIQLPPMPTPTPITPIIETRIVEQTSKLGIFSAAALGVAGLALLLAIYVMLKYRVPQRVGNAIGDAAKAVTEIGMVRKRGTPRRARASLLILKEDGSPGETIALTGQSMTIGRDPSRAQIVIAHPTVSRLHAKIEEETTGVFRLIDEGASYGTYVNEERLTSGGSRRLMARDEIELGDVRLLFQPNAVDGADETEPSAPPDKRKTRRGTGRTGANTTAEDNTTPYVDR